MDRSNNQTVILGKTAQGKSSAALAALFGAELGELPTGRSASVGAITQVDPAPAATTSLDGAQVRLDELVELRRGPIFVISRNGARQIKTPPRPEGHFFL